MSKQVINVGTKPNDRSGDSLRTSFQKVNANFTELYNALGLDDNNLNVGSFEFTGNTITTTDSSSVVIDQATTITSNLTVGGDVLPSIANGGDLGSLEKPWRSLYVSNSTVYLGGVPLSLEQGTNALKVNNVPIGQTITYADIPDAPAVPVDISELTDTTGLLGQGGGGASTGDITFDATTISAPNSSNITIQSKDSVGDVKSKVELNPEAGIAKLESIGVDSQGFYNWDGSWTTATWTDSGQGYGTLTFTNASTIISFLANNSDRDNGTNNRVNWNGGPTFAWGDWEDDGGDLYIYVDTALPPDGLPVEITELILVWDAVSKISVDSNYYNQVELSGAGLAVRINSTVDVDINAGANLTTEANGNFTVRNRSRTQAIEFTTDYTDQPKQWALKANGSTRFPIRNAPTSSTGVPGDQRGDIVVTNDYIYYCTNNYPTLQYWDMSLTRETVDSNVFYITTQGLPLNITGYVIQLNPAQDGPVGTIISAVSANGEWEITTDLANTSAAAGTPIKVSQPPSTTDIWKRVAWSGDTW